MKKLTIVSAFRVHRYYTEVQSEQSVKNASQNKNVATHKTSTEKKIRKQKM